MPAAPFGLRFWVYLAMGLLAATLKVRVPGLHGTFSLTFFIFVLAIADLTWLEAVIVLAVSQALQTIWHSVDRIVVKRVLFNAAAVVISMTAAYIVVERINAGGPHSRPLLRMLVASVIYFASNTAIVGGINVIESARPYGAVLFSWWRWCAVYYLIGVGLALLVVLLNLYLGWGIGFLLTPLLFQEHIRSRPTPMRGVLRPLKIKLVSILRRLLAMIDHKYVDGSLSRFQSQSKLLLNSREE
ncbi:MAG TPA: hypothetical protein VKS01_06945 [Bryobacteraceae bacterium]|nr:hypothetical protein [Bryobacteraceae bacterium]